MKQTDLVLPPEDVYPVDDWRMVQVQFSERFLPQDETIFALGNGYLGLRGSLDEGRPVFQSGTFINGFHETWPIVYGEEAFGFARTGQTMLNVTDAKTIRLYVDDEPFFLPTARLLGYERALDMRAGTLDRAVLWETPSGKRVAIRSRRLVSFVHRHLAAVSYEVTVENAAAALVISSEIDENPPNLAGKDDPRQGRGFDGRILVRRAMTAAGTRVLLGHQTLHSKMTLACGVDHVIDAGPAGRVDLSHGEGGAKLVLAMEARPGEPVRLIKYVTYQTSRSAPAEELCERTARTLDRAIAVGFAPLVRSQREYLDDFWRRSDVEIRGEHPRAQQCVRFSLFQMFQAAARAEGAGVGARGLTGQAYDGHYFWDMEMYILPFFTYTSPRIARTLLTFRASHLDDARRRARELNQNGALFPWRTINGQEASAYYAAGTAQYHIDADIAFAMRKYAHATGDEAFLHGVAAEVLVETARLWVDLGFYSERRGGRFCIHGVTGPDEYNTVVNNNAYTNLMARENLWSAVAVVESMRRHHPAQFRTLVHETGLRLDEIEEWRRAADAMYVPYDEALGIHPQDDSFLDKEPWDFENTPREKYPLLLHFHPLVIYRHRVIKQADVILAMFLLGNEFSEAQKRRNFDYYDPLTTGDSSLSASVQAILAAELGYEAKADEYLRHAALMDLADVGGNVKDGCHIASMGGTWMALVYGLAGMRDHGGKLSFHPRIARRPQKLRFPLTVRGQRFEVDIDVPTVTYRLLEGAGLAIEHCGEEIQLQPGHAVSRPLPDPTKPAA